MNSFAKGMAAGLVVGAATTAVLMPKSCKSKRAMKSSAGKAIKAVGSLIDNFQSMLD
jgi:gas vesicle protein